jgi:hypothetical protein
MSKKPEKHQPPTLGLSEVPTLPVVLTTPARDLPNDSVFRILDHPAGEGPTPCVVFEGNQYRGGFGSPALAQAWIDKQPVKG